MSNKLLNLVRDARFSKVGGVGPTEKEVLKVIADQSNDAGSGVWSSQAYIAWCIERARSTVNKSIGKLVDAGLIESTQRTGTSNLYSINIVNLEKISVRYRDRIVLDEDLSVSETPPVLENDTPSPADGHKPLDNQVTNLNMGDTFDYSVITPDGIPVPDKMVCQHCRSAPKQSGKLKFCHECSEIGKCQRCRDNKIERYPTKRKELCAICGPEVQEFYDSRAVATYKKRNKSQLKWAQVELMVRKVGDVEKDLYTWGKLLDHWVSKGWHTGASALGAMLENFEDRKEYGDQGRKGTAQSPARRPQFVDARPKTHSQAYPGADVIEEDA